MTGFDNYRDKRPESLTDEERYHLGRSFVDASRIDDQDTARRLGITLGDAVAIALNHFEGGIDSDKFIRISSAQAPTEL